MNRRSYSRCAMIERCFLSQEKTNISDNDGGDVQSFPHESQDEKGEENDPESLWICTRIPLPAEQALWADSHGHPWCKV